MPRQLATGAAILLLLIPVARASLRVPPPDRTERQLTQIQRALNAYGAEFGAFPPVASWEQELLGSSGSGLNTNRIVFIEGGFEELNDAWGHPLVYAFGSRGVRLYSTGADGISASGGDDPDDINNWNTDRPWREFYERKQARSEIAGRMLNAMLVVGLVAICVFIIKRVRKVSPR